LHCGAVIFGDFGAKNRIAVTVLGETVNTAARYEQAKSSELGRIRISPALKEKLPKPGNLTFGEPNMVTVKESEIVIFSINPET
jgi:class 3 adenylate cyclase